MAEAKLSPLINSLSGTLGNFVFRNTRNGPVVANPSKRPRREPTEEQRAVQQYLGAAAKAWKTLTEGQREAWEKYAAVYFPLDRDRSGAGPRGQAVFNKAAWFRLAAGLALPADPPSGPPPAPATEVTARPVGSESEVSFSVTHSISPPAGHLLYVELTPPRLSPARRFLRNDFRAAKGIAPESFLPLGVSGTNYTLNGVRFQLADQVAFGIRLIIVDPFGIPSQPLEGVLQQAIR